jgi:hypothetical protein
VTVNGGLAVGIGAQQKSGVFLILREFASLPCANEALSWCITFSFPDNLSFLAKHGLSGVCVFLIWAGLLFLRPSKATLVHLFFDSVSWKQAFTDKPTFFCPF